MRQNPEEGDRPDGGGPGRDLEPRALAGAVLRLLAGTLVLRINLRRVSRHVPGCERMARYATRQEREQAAAARGLGELATRLGRPPTLRPRELVRLSSVTPMALTMNRGGGVRQLLAEAHRRLAADCETAGLLAAAAGDEAAQAVLVLRGRAHAAEARMLGRSPIGPRSPSSPRSGG